MLLSLSLSFSCHSPNITSPQSDLTTAVSSPRAKWTHLCGERKRKETGERIEAGEWKSSGQEKQAVERVEGYEGGGSEWRV